MIRFALVGCGRIGQKHAQLCNEFGKLVAVCDIVKDKCETFGKQFGADYYLSIEELIKQKDLDVLVICTPNGLHAKHSTMGLSAGLHVICEKPMALFVPDCERMIETAKSQNKELFIVKQNRFNPAVEAVKELLDNETLGIISSVQLNCLWNRESSYYQNSWHGTKDMDGGILFTQFSHFIDILYWTMGNLKTVHSYTKKFRQDVNMHIEDTGVACFEMENGALGSLHFSVNSFHKNMEGSYTILGENGSVKIGGQYLNEISYQDIKDLQIQNLPAHAAVNDYGSYQGSMSNHDKIYEHVTEVLAGKKENQFSGADGLKCVEIIQKIYQAG